MNKALNYSDVITVWLDEDENNIFKPNPGCAYCLHYKDAGGEDKTANIFFDLLSKYDGVDSCEKCPFSRDARPSGRTPCKYMDCEGLLPKTFDFSADNSTLLFDDHEYVVVDSDELEERILEDASERLDELHVKLAGCHTLEEIEGEYNYWLDFTPGYLRDVLERDGVALKAVETRKAALGLESEPAKKKKGRPRKAKEKKEENAEPPIAPTPEPKKSTGKKKAASVPTTQPVIVAPVMEPAPVLYASADQSDDRRKQWEDALLELDKEARGWELKAAIAKRAAKDASDRAKSFREKIHELLSGGSENYVEQTPLFKGLDDDGLDSDDLKAFEESLDRDFER